MPIYEYQCRACTHIWDELQKLSDPEPESCPKCAQRQVSRKLTAAAFRLKGAGWYETDFKGDKDSKRNLVDAPESAPAKEPATASDAKAPETAKPDTAAKASEVKPAESKPAVASASDSKPPAANPSS